MIDPVTMLRDGGPFMYALVLFGLIGTPFAVVFALAIGGMKARFPASIGWTVLTGAALVGLLGTWMGASMTHEAAARASVEMRQAMVAQGLSVSMYTTVGWLLIVGTGFLTVAFTAWLPALLAPGPESRLDVGSAGASIGGGVLGSLVGVAAMLTLLGPGGLRDSGPVLLLLPPISFFAVLAMVLASLRVSEEPKHRGRIAGSRFFLGTAALLGIGLLGEAFVLMGEVLAFQAVAMASADMKQRLLMNGLYVASYARIVGWGAALAPAWAGWAGALLHLGHLDARQAFGTLVAWVQVMVLFGCLFLASSLRDVDMLFP